jgi:hypothetical protein
MSRVSTSSAPIHWSKDFAEHLRTVHFSLIGIATGLLLIVFSAKPYDPSVALRQIRQILELKKIWSPEWIMSRGDFGYILFKQPQKQAQALPLRSSNAVTAVTLATRDFVNAKNVDFNLPPGRFFEEGPTPLSQTFPTTLISFHDWWDNMLKGYEVYVPSELCATGEYKSTDLSASPQRSGHLKILDTFRMKEEDKLKPRVDLILRVLLEGVETADPDRFAYEGIDQRRALVYTLPVCAVQTMTVRQKNIGSRFDWDEGVFRVAFSDLAKATTKTDTLELEDVEKLVADDASRGSEVFEAFGMKFPAAQITLWGIIVLLGVQLYFLVYLKQLSGKLGPADAAWDVPWLGMDTSVLARAILFFTVIVLPISAILALSMHAAYARPFRWNRWTGSEVACLSVAFVLSFLMSVYCWKFRPKVQHNRTDNTGPIRADVDDEHEKTRSES